MPAPRPIFLDHHSTTPCDPRVVEAMLPAFTTQFGNAASRQHAYGWEAEALVDRAREQVATLINAGPTEIVFTSGATESDNLAIKGAARILRSKGNHIITSAIEHHAVLDSCHRLEIEGFAVTYLPVGSDGLVNLSDIESAIRPETILVSIMFANNEIGTLNPIAEIGALCKRREILFHCDAVQALAHLPCDVQALGIDLLSISAHKMYGPKGVGALYVRRRNPRVQLEPLFDGGGHERGFRSGTLNVPGIIGLGRACELLIHDRESDAARIARLRDRLRAIIEQEIPDARLNGSPDHRLPNNLNYSFPGVDGDALLTALSGSLALSSGSACTSASLEPSYVLRALGLPAELAQASIRIGLGRFNTDDEIERAGTSIVAAVLALRG